MSMSKLVGSGAPSAAEKRERMRGLPVPQTRFLALRQEGSPPSCTPCFSDTSGTLKSPIDRCITIASPPHFSYTTVGDGYNPIRLQNNKIYSSDDEEE